MDATEHIAAVARDAAAITAVIGSADPAAAVPTCPGWTVVDLARHTGQFAGFWAHVLCEGSGRPKPDVGDMPEGGDIAGWFDRAAGHLVTELRETPPDTTVWTWAAGEDRPAFIARRAAHELSVHRVDAQLAVGDAEPIDAALAADGIEEIFVIVDKSPEHAGRGAGETLHLHGTDRGDEWLLTLGAGGLEVERRHAKGDLALRASVSDLELMLYQRPPHGPVERFGDDSVLDAWRRVFTFG